MKAYKLSVKNLVIDEPWHYDDIIVYADSHGEAKVKGLTEFDSGQVEDYTQINYKGEYLRDITFLDIRARRIKKYDKVLYKDRWITQQELEQYKWMEKRDKEAEDIWKNNPYGVAVVWAGCYNSYWGANKAGYWSKIEDAGKYSTEEAYEIVKGSNYDRQEKVILLDKEQYNTELLKKIANLQSSLI